MTATIEVFDPASGTFEDIRVRSRGTEGAFVVEYGTSDTDTPAPKATVYSDTRQAITAGQQLRITEDGTTVFDGIVTDAPIDGSGTRDIEAEDPAYRLFDEEVSLTVTGPPTVTDVLNAALSASDRGADFTLSVPGTPPTLGDTYEVEGRTVSRVFRDMADRAGRIYWVSPDRTIHVETYGSAGTVGTVDTSSQNYAARLDKYDDTDLKSVQNAVTVVGTGAERVEGFAEDSTSINEYGRQPERVNVSYITSASEADAYAEQLLVPDPLPTVTATTSTNYPDEDLRSPVVNQTVTIVDPANGVDETVPVEKQTVQQGQATLAGGEGATAAVKSYNRDQKSSDDVTEPGSVYGSDRIGEASIVESKLADLSVSVTKIQNDAVNQFKIENGEVTETEVGDDAISTPKLQANAITAAKIDAGAVTANAIQADAVEAGKIDADAVGARELIANSITADEIDVLNLEAGELSITDPNSNAAFTFAPITTQAGDGIGLEPTGPGRLGAPSNALIEIVAQFISPENDGDGQLGAFGAYGQVNAYDHNAAGGIAGGVSDEIVEVLEDHEARLDALEP